MNEIEFYAPASRLTSGVERTTLPNGLKVLVKESRTSPVVALLVSVGAGYFNEEDRVSGIAHVIEHMIFKGTPNRPEDEQFAREIRELGGTLNAATYYEETYYYVIAPAENLEKAVEVQADALQNALYDSKELAKELEVIIQESLQKRDNPSAMLFESLYELAFDKHRISRWRIGHPDPLRALTHDDLAEFVKGHYRPENMSVTLVGDFEASEALKIIEKYWGILPRGEVKRELSPDEPSRSGFRYRRMKADTKQRLMTTLFPAPPILHADAAALMVLCSILSDGRSSRLNRKLKEELQIANGSWASYEPFERMGLFKLGGESRDDDPLKVEVALWEAVCEIAENGVTREELERVVTRMEMGRLTSQEEVFGVARTLSSYETLGDYRLADVLPERIKAVTSEDLKRVIQTWLKLEKASLLEYLPIGGDVQERTAESILSELSEVRISVLERVASPTPPVLQKALAPAFNNLTIETLMGVSESKSIKLSGGGTLLYKRRTDLPLISVQTGFRGGKRAENSSLSGITNLMLKSSVKGTSSYSAQEIANKIEALGSGIGYSAAPDYFSYGFKIQTDRLKDAFAIFREVLTCPVFAEEEIEKERQSIYAEIRRQQDNNFALAYDLFNAACYGNHPYGLPMNGIAEAVEGLTSEDLQAWNAFYMRPENLVAAVVGDLSEEAAVELFSDFFSGRQRGASLNSRTRDALSAKISPPSLSGTGSREIQRQKKQTAVTLGFAGAKNTDKDRYALDVLNEITSSMGGRFFRAVRGENALAYSVTSIHRSRQDAGNFIAYASTSPENEHRVRDILGSEIQRLSTERVTEQELRTAKATLIGEEAIGSQTFGSQAAELAYNGIFGLPLDETRRYLEEISKVTYAQIQEVATRYLTSENSWVGLVRGENWE